MRTRLFSIVLTLLFLLLVCSPTTFGQYAAHTQLSLPEGAKARLGKGSISEIAHSPDSSLLAVGSSIGIRLYDTETFQEIALLTGHTGAVYSVSFSPDGQTLSSGSFRTVDLWDVRTP